MSRDSTPPDSAPEQLALLLGIAERLVAAGNDRAALAELQRETRKIQGAAASQGFVEASRLAAGMHATVTDWASRPDDLDVDRGSLTLWFVTRLAAMLKLPLPRRAVAPRPKPAAAPARRPTAAPPPSPPPPPPPAPPPPHPPPPPPPLPRLIIRRPSAAQPAPGPKRLRDLVPDDAPAPVAASPPEPPPPPPPPREPPAAARAQELTWLVAPEEAQPTPEPPAAVAPPEPPPDVAPPIPEPQPAETTATIEPPAPEPPPVVTPPIPKFQPAETTATIEPPAPEPPPSVAPPIPEPQPAETTATIEPPAPEPPPSVAPPIPESQPAETTAVAEPPAPEAPPAAAVEVIYVEDDPALAELLEYGLRARGYRFLSYRNGGEALRELLVLDVGGTHPLLLLDVDLPALDGYSIFEALQRERPGTYRVVFTTVHGSEDEQLRGLEAGALDYLIKPISLRVALEKIKRWVGR